MKVNLTYKALTVGAYQTAPIAVTGSVFFCKTCTASFKLIVDSAEEVDWDKGWGFKLESNLSFRMLNFRNPTNTAITIVYYAGTQAVFYSAPVDYDVFSQASSSYGKGMAAVGQLDGGATAAYTGLDGAKRRKQIVVTNLSATLNLYVLDSNSKIIGVVFPNSAWTLETNASLIVSNPNGAGQLINYVVGETFYA